MHEEVKIVLEKYKEKHKEVEEYLKNQGEIQITFSVGHIKKLLNAGKIPRELGEWFLKDYEDIEKRRRQRQEFLKTYPDVPIKERPLTPEEQAKLYEDMFLSSQCLMYLLQNKHLLINDKEESLMTTQGLFNDVDTIEEFGIASCISNSLYHLKELLKNTELVSLYEGLFEAKGSVKNSKGEAISLTYTFPAQTEEEAQSILKNYQATMATKGLKVWMAYWIMANKLGRTEYSCPMVDVMKLVADEERQAFFSVKEKEEHWALTKMLSLSRLSRERKIRKKGTSAEVLEWVEQPFLEIQGGEKEVNARDKYPLTVSVRVLMPRMDKRGFAPTIYKNNTALLSPSDTLLAFLLQTRAGQMNRGAKNLHYDWGFIFKAGNLQPTALSNQRGAKAKARKKMDRLQKNKIIEKWNEEPMGVCVTPKKQNRKERDKDKKNST